MASFADPEIRNTVMEQSEPATLFALMAASPDAFRSFMRYPNTFAKASVSSLGHEQSQVRQILEALVTKPSEDELSEHTTYHGGEPRTTSTTLDYFLENAHWTFADPHPLDRCLKVLGGPMKVLGKLARVQNAIDVLEAAPIWSFKQEHFDLYHDNYPLLPLETGWLKEVLWDFQLYCALFSSTNSIFPSDPTASHSDGPFKFLYEMEDFNFDGYELVQNFITVYTDLFRMLAKTYEQHMARIFEVCYVRNIDDAKWKKTWWAKVTGGRGKVKHSVKEDFQAQLEAQMLLGLPFLAEVAQKQSNPENGERLPELTHFSDGAFLAGRQPWACQEYKGFELSPLSDGRIGYKLSLVFEDCSCKPLGQVDFDEELFTNGYQPPDLGSIEEAQKEWHKEIFDEDMRTLHESDSHMFIYNYQATDGVNSTWWQWLKAGVWSSRALTNIWRYIRGLWHFGLLYGISSSSSGWVEVEPEW